MNSENLRKARKAPASNDQGPDEKETFASAVDQSVDSSDAGPAAPPIRIKKYANRRLYNTSNSGYETLESLAKMVRDGIDFNVSDARTGEDLTRQVLTQIILEAESRGDEHLMPMRFLRDLIRCYGENVQNLVPGYLEMSMDMMKKNHESFFQSVGQTVGKAANPFRQAEEILLSNSRIFADSLAKMVAGNPFAAQAGEAAKKKP